MAVPQYHDEALVTLSSLDPPATFCHPHRRFWLTKENPTMNIGRTSKRNSKLEATVSNGWFDSAVMSRDHAQIRFDSDTMKVYIKDTGSLHGTFKNDEQIQQHTRSLLRTGDILTFGISIERGSETFPPCVMKARVEYGTASPHERTNHFTVPDETDAEESESDAERSILHTSQRMLRALSRQQSAFPTRGVAHLHEQPPVSYVRALDNDRTVEAPQITSPIPTRPSNIQGVNHIDLTAYPSDDDEPEPSRFSPISQRPDLLMGLHRDDGVPPSQGSDIRIDDDSDEWMDTSPSVSPGESLSPSSCPSPSPSLSPSPIPVSGSQGVLLEQEGSHVLGFDYYVDKNVDNDVDDNTDSEGYASPSPHTSPETQQHRPIQLCRSQAAQDALVKPLGAPPIYPIGFPAPEATENSLESLTAFAVEEFKANNHPNMPALQFQRPDDYLVRLPSLATNHSSCSSMKLPPLVEATSQAPSHVRFQETQASGFLGEKTGKHEYFRAREVNKTQAASRQVQQPWTSMDEVAKTSMQPVPLVSRSFSGEAVTNRSASQQPTTEVAQIQDQNEENILEPFHMTPPPDVGMPEVPQITVQNPSYSSSGEDINRPSPFDANSAADLQRMRREAEERRIEKSETIAPQTEQTEGTEQTKGTEQTEGTEARGVNVLAMEDQAPPLDDQKIVVSEDTPASLGTSDPRVSPKRKAAEISQLTPEEEAAADAPRERIPRHSTPRAYRRRGNRVRFAEPAAPPPSKRLRRVAEVFGYAALGGVAVMSALIATAPTL